MRYRMRDKSCFISYAVSDGIGRYVMPFVSFSTRRECDTPVIKLQLETHSMFRGLR